MVPNNFFFLKELPLTPNGKVDKKALKDLREFDKSSEAEYVAPRNETEKVLAAIWKELLHVDRVGIHDNFFELGGDSIITIQVVNRARRIGYELKPKDLFIHQTIDSLSMILSERSESAILGEQGVLTGSAGLIPIQQWYLNREAKNISHFNQSVLLAIDKSITPEILNRVVERLTTHHDALRFKYNRNGKQWHQEYGTKTTELSVLDLKSADESLLGNLITEHSNTYSSSRCNNRTMYC